MTGNPNEIDDGDDLQDSTTEYNSELFQVFSKYHNKRNKKFYTKTATVDNIEINIELYVHNSINFIFTQKFIHVLE